jgi:hypothetical protein
MADWKAQVVIKTADNVPENFISNQFAFTQAAGVLDFVNAAIAIKDFYDDILTYLSPDIAQLGHEVKFYDLPGFTPNYPVDTQLWNLSAAPSGTPWPREVSVCLSFQGTKSPGFPQARRRGRIYLGPFDETVNDSGRPVAALRTAIGTAAATFKGTVSGLTGSPEWAIWSASDGASVVVDNGWIDNSFDTQRRRGVVSTARTIF